MAQKLFHESFGFTRAGISANTLVAPQITHLHTEKMRYGFLRSAYQGRPVFSDARLFLNMNPAQILGVMVGYSVAVRAGNDHFLKMRKPSYLYVNLLMEARSNYEKELDQVEDAALGSGVNPFHRSDATLNERLKDVISRNRDITEKFKESFPGMELSVRDKSTDVYDPNCDACSHGPSNRAIYAKELVNGLQQMYTKFSGTEAFAPETDKAEQAAENHL